MALSATSSTASDSAPASGGVLTEHFRQLLKVAPIALLIALIAGGVTLAIIKSADPRYQVVAAAQIDAQVPVVTGDAYLFQNSAPYLALSSSRDIHQAIADRMGQGWDASKVGSSVTVGVSQSPLILDVTASASTPEEAAKLAEQTIEVLDASSREQRAREFDRAVASQTEAQQELSARLARLAPNARERATLQVQLDNIQGQIDRIRSGGVNGLSALSVPDAGDAVQTAPRSASLAFFVALVTFIVAAELLALLRTRFGRGITLAEAKRIGRSQNVGVELAAGNSASLPPVTRALTARYWGRGERTQFLASQATEAYARRWHDEFSDAIVMADAGSAWQISPDESVAQAVLVVALGEKFRTELRNGVGVIRELGIAGRIVVVRPGSADAPESSPADT